MTVESDIEDIKRRLASLSEAVNQIGKAVEELIDGRVQPMTKALVRRARG